MGCCQSCFRTGTHPEKNHEGHQKNSAFSRLHPSSATADAQGRGGIGAVPPFSEFSLSDLKSATNSFSSDFIVSETGERAPNLVYKGVLHNGRSIAVKKFTKMAWPDPKQFAVSLKPF